MSDDELIGSGEAADICGVHRATFLRWVEDDEIEPAGRSSAADNAAYLFRRADVLALARSKAPAGAASP